MGVLTCLLRQRRIGAYLDGALEGRAVASTARHLADCPRCQRQAAELSRLRALLARALEPASTTEPDWTGFWPGIVRGIEDGRHRRPAPERLGRRWRPKWAISGALAAILLASATLWQFGSAPVPGEPAIIVSSADTEYPQGTVMVYSGQNLAVVWIFGIDE